MISSSDILKASILIVDDQAAMSRCWSKCCAGWLRFHRVHPDPHEVCELHRKNRYDLILLDLQMPAWTDSK